MLIAIEGPDGSGKTTQAKLLAEHLRKQGYDVLVVEEPGTTALGRSIRAILLDSPDSQPQALEIEPLAELFLYEASRAQLVREVLRPALAAGKVVIADRYALSSLAYQGYGRGLPLELVRKLNELATDGLEPDLVFLLDLPPEEGLRRKVARRGREEGVRRDRLESAALDFHRRVRRGYLELIKDHPRGYLLDGRMSPEELHQRIVAIVEGRLRGERKR